MDRPIAHKSCSRCRQVKDAGDFHRHKQYEDGLFPYCKACGNAAARKWQSKNKDRVRVAQLQRHNADPDRGDGVLSKKCARCRSIKDGSDFGRSWKTKDGLTYHCKGCLAKQMADWKAANYQRMLEHQRKSDAKNKQASRGRRRAMKVGVLEDFTATQTRFVHSHWGHKCAICGHRQMPLFEGQLHIDHWLPLSKGYALAMGNAVLMCKNCNSSKHDRLPRDYFDAATVASIERRLSEQVRLWQLEPTA